MNSPAKRRQIQSNVQAISQSTACRMMIPDQPYVMDKPSEDVRNDDAILPAAGLHQSCNRWPDQPDKVPTSPESHAISKQEDHSKIDAHCRPVTSAGPTSIVRDHNLCLVLSWNIP